MNEKKSRTLLFILGISIGLLVGATAVYFTTSNNKSKGEVSENMVEQIVNKVYGLLSRRKDNQDSLELNADAQKERVQSETKPSKIVLTQPVTIDSTASSKIITVSQSDSLQNDSNTNNTIAMANASENIVVKKDELTEVKMVELLNLDYTSSKTNSKSDSLLQAVSGLHDDTKMVEEKYTYQVELWNSPINYKGYKLGKNKLALFGINQDTPLKLFYLNDATYLKCADVFYKLETSNDYRAFEKILNPQLITQLNK